MKKIILLFIAISIWGTNINAQNKEKKEEKKTKTYSFNFDNGRKEMTINGKKYNFQKDFDFDMSIIRDLDLDSALKDIEISFNSLDLDKYIAMTAKKGAEVAKLNIEILGDNQKQLSLFDRFCSNKNITTVYITKAMLNMAPNDMGMGNVMIKNLAKKLDQIEIYTSETKEAASLMKASTSSLSRNKSYELLMSIKDGDDLTTFYGVKNNNLFKELIMITSETTDCVIIRMIGTFTIEDIQKVANKKKL